MIIKPPVLRAVCAMLISNLCATHIAYAQHAPAPVPAPTPARSAVSPVAPLAAPVGGIGMAASSVAIAGKLDLDNVITVAGETVKLHAVFSRGGAPVNGASLQFKVDGASVGQGVTGANGATDVPYKLIDSLTLGAHTIHVIFPGDSKTSATNASAQLTVLKSITTLSSAIGTGSIWGRLNGASEQSRLGNRKLGIKRDGVTVATVYTDKWGDYEFKYGEYPWNTYLVEFEGETNYLGTTKTVKLQPPPGLGPHININLPH